MKIGVIGPGRIGGGIARQLAAAGHALMLSYRSDREKAEHLAREIGAKASVGTAAEVVAFAEVVIFSVPWGAIPQALEQMGSLEGKIVIDTTNQFGAPPLPGPGETAAHFNSIRMKGARYTKSFNTLTSGFQAKAAARTGNDRVVQWLCGNDREAKTTVCVLIADAGFVPVDLGRVEACAVMEAPRRRGAVYGEEYRLEDSRAVVAALRSGLPIPPTPSY